MCVSSHHIIFGGGQLDKNAQKTIAVSSAFLSIRRDPSDVITANKIIITEKDLFQYFWNSLSVISPLKSKNKYTWYFCNSAYLCCKHIRTILPLKIVGFFLQTMTILRTSCGKNKLVFFQCRCIWGGGDHTHCGSSVLTHTHILTPNLSKFPTQKNYFKKNPPRITLAARFCKQGGKVTKNP